MRLLGTVAPDRAPSPVRDLTSFLFSLSDHQGWSGAWEEKKAGRLEIGDGREVKKGFWYQYVRIYKNCL